VKVRISVLLCFEDVPVFPIPFFPRGRPFFFNPASDIV
jgi:hypothetical protein